MKTNCNGTSNPKLDKNYSAASPCPNEEDQKSVENKEVLLDLKESSKEKKNLLSVLKKNFKIF